MQESTIKNLQATMKAHCFYTGDVDGVWGNKSQGAFYAMADAAKQCPAVDDQKLVNNEPPFKQQSPNGKFMFSSCSASLLSKVHKDLQKVINRALEISEVDFMVIEGLRTITRQKQMVATGMSKTMNSRHLTGHAVDIYPIDENGNVVRNWEGEYFHKMAKAVKQAAKELNIPIEWGGDWKTIVDGPHFQLPWSAYSRDS